MKVAVIDLETTGFTPFEGQVVEVGIAVLDTKKETIEPLYSAITFDGGDLNEDAWIFHNSDLSPELVRRARPLNVERLQEICDKYPMTAFNRKFDFNFLEHAGLRINKYPCIMLMSRKVMKQSKWPSVEEAYRRFFPGEYKERHRALDDALDEAKILLYCLKETRKCYT